MKPISLAKYLSKLIEPPREEDVIRVINRLDALSAFDIKGSKGYINSMGIEMSRFQTKPEYAKMLIASFKYNCRDEVCQLLALMELTQLQFQQLFKEPRSKKKNMAESAKLKKEFDKARSKFKSKDGDHISILKIYKEFAKKRYITKTNTIKGGANNTLDNNNKPRNSIFPNPAKKWCAENYLNYGTLDRVKYHSKDIFRKFNISSMLEIKDNSSYFGSNSNPSSNWEINVMKSIYEGLYVNLANKIGRSYTSCFSDEKSVAGISRDSLFNLSKSPCKYIIFTEYKSIFNRPSFGMIARASPQLIEDIKTKYRVSVIDKCSKSSTEFTHNMKHSYGKKHSRGKKHSHDKKHSYGKKHSRGKKYYKS